MLPSGSDCRPAALSQGPNGVAQRQNRRGRPFKEAASTKPLTPTKRKAKKPKVAQSLAARYGGGGDSSSEEEDDGAVSDGSNDDDEEMSEDDFLPARSAPPQRAGGRGAAGAAGAGASPAAKARAGAAGRGGAGLAAASGAARPRQSAAARTPEAFPRHKGVPGASPGKLLSAKEKTKQQRAAELLARSPSFDFNLAGAFSLTNQRGSACIYTRGTKCCKTSPYE